MKSRPRSDESTVEAKNLLRKARQNADQAAADKIRYEEAKKKEKAKVETKEEVKTSLEVKVAPLSTIAELPENKTLDSETLNALHIQLAKESKEIENAARLSKEYLEDELGIVIHRGGIVVTREDGDAEYSIWMVEKDYEFEQNFGKAVVAGKGVHSTVKIIVNASTGEKRVIKVLLDRNADFKQEVANLKQLNQTAILIPKLYSAKKSQNKKVGKYCIMMDYIPGVSLSRLLDKHELSPRERIHIFKNACKHVAYIHHRGLVHCDLGPQNIIFDAPTNTVRVYDFGLAAPNGHPKDIPSSRGTPGYIANFMQDTTAFVPSFDVFSMGRIARELFYFPTYDPDIRCVGDLDFQGRSGFTLAERNELKNLIFEMENPVKSKMTMWKAYERMKAFQQRWEQVPNRDEKQQEPSHDLVSDEKKQELSHYLISLATHFINRIHAALATSDFSAAILGMLELDDLVNSHDDSSFFKTEIHESLRDKKIFDPEQYKMLCHSAYLVKEASDSKGLEQSKLEEYMRDLGLKSYYFLGSIELFREFTAEPLPSPQFQRAHYVAKLADKTVARTIQNILAPSDRFACYVADVVKDENGMKNAKEVLSFFENCSYLENFFGKGVNNLWDFIEMPFYTSLSGGFKKSQDAIKQFEKSPQSELDIIALFNTFNQDIAKEWEIFWKNVLSKNNNDTYKQRIDIIQEHLCFSFRSRMIISLTEQFFLTASSSLIKKLDNANAKMKTDNLKPKYAAMKAIALPQLQADARRDETKESDLRARVAIILKNYKLSRIRKREHDTDVGMLAVIFDIKDIPQRKAIEDANFSEKFVKLCQPFHYRERIEFIENILLESLRRWGVSNWCVDRYGAHFGNGNWPANEANDAWKTINNNLSKNGHTLFKGLYNLLSQIYINSPEIVEMNQSKFIRAMVFRLTKTQLQEQKRNAAERIAPEEARLAFAEFNPPEKKREVKKFAQFAAAQSENPPKRLIIGMFHGLRYEKPPQLSSKMKKELSEQVREQERKHASERKRAFEQRYGRQYESKKR